MKIYKIVHLATTGVLWSYNAHCTVFNPLFCQESSLQAQHSSLRYLPGEWTKPLAAATPLWGFADLKSARELFIGSTNQIWEAEAVVVREFQPRVGPRRVIDTGGSDYWGQRLTNFWKGWRKFHHVRPGFTGIVLCARLKLTKKVL